MLIGSFVRSPLRAPRAGCSLRTAKPARCGQLSARAVYVPCCNTFICACARLCCMVWQAQSHCSAQPSVFAVRTRSRRLTPLRIAPLLLTHTPRRPQCPWGALHSCAHRGRCVLALNLAHRSAMTCKLAPLVRRLNALEAQLESMNLSEEDKRRERERHAKKEKEYSRLQRHAMSVDDFDLLTIVGRGAFGEVRIVREKSSCKLFAMKKLKKSDTVKKNQVEHVKAEREALSIVQSPFIVTLFYSFQDADYLYLVMEYLPGGDVMTLLIRKDILSEHEVRFYIAETVLALEAIHAKGYLHRHAPALRVRTSCSHLLWGKLGRRRQWRRCQP